VTLPFERDNAVTNTREFLRRLLDPKATPKVPKYIRMMARSLLKHYPTRLDFERNEELGELIAAQEKAKHKRKVNKTLKKMGVLSE
jgi:hypothetical protein